MKSITKKISLLIVLSVTLFLSSCLDTGSQHYIGTKEISYITEGQLTGKVYARTIAGLYITSPKIALLTPGTIARLSYQVKPDENEQVAVDENVKAYIVELGAEPETMDQTILNFSSAPDVPAVKFESLREPLFFQHDFFGDRWIFPYTFKMKKGESVKVSFYIASDEDAKAVNSTALIDVRLEKFGTAEANATDKIEGDNIVVDFSEIRSYLADKADTQGKISIKFRYYNPDSDKLYTSNNGYLMHIEQK